MSQNPAPDLSKCAQYLKALGDPIRLKMITALQSGPKSVSDLAELLETELPNVSHHLRVLYHAEVVETQRDGKFIYYSLNRDIFQAKSPKSSVKMFDFGCCKLDLPTAD